MVVKKTLKHPKADEQAQEVFQQKMQAYEAEGKNLVYLDESGFAQDMPLWLRFERKTLLWCSQLAS